jgi:hypothetical protein
MDCKTILNSIGFLLTIIGVYIVFVNSPINIDTIDGGDFNTDFTEIKRITNKRNTWLKRGVFIVIIGSFAQLISNFIFN